MARHLSDLGVKALRPKATRYEKPAGHGLYVVVQPSGAKSFALRYRYAAKTRKLTLSGGLSLAAARKAAADALFQVEQGHDPAVARQQRNQAQRLADADTFAAVAAEYFRREGRGLRSVKRRQQTIDRLVLPVIGDRPIGEIKRSELVRLLDRVEENNGPAMADDVLAFVRRIMNWHATRSDDFRSPVIRGMARTKAKERARSRILSDDELRKVVQTAKNEKAKGAFPALVLFLLETAARRDEARCMTWAELNGGSDWVLPASRNKVGLDLVRPLSKPALNILAGLPRIDGGDFVFSNTGRRPFSGLSRAKAKFDKLCGVTGWTLHDLRRTARSLMSRAGVNSDHAERCLGHVIGGVRGTYDRHEYRSEKAAAYAALAALIERIVHPSANVTELPAAKKSRRK
jgi:integrase